MSSPLLSAILALGATLSAGLRAPPTATVLPLSSTLRAAMTGTSWHPGCPVPLDELRVVIVPHLDEEGQPHAGQLIVHVDHAQAIGDLFSALFAQGFVVPSVTPAHTFGGDDDAMMRANNTSAFNCRPVSGTGTWSEHAWGRAVDLNPLWNPYVRSGGTGANHVEPPEGLAFVPRQAGRVGTVVDGDPVVAAFAALGWRWGGHWSRSQDYQHFSANGR